MLKHISSKAFNTLQQPTQTRHETKQRATSANIHPRGLLSKHTLNMLLTEQQSYSRVREMRGRRRRRERGGWVKKKENND